MYSFIPNLETKPNENNHLPANFHSESAYISKISFITQICFRAVMSPDINIIVM